MIILSYFLFFMSKFHHKKSNKFKNGNPKKNYNLNLSLLYINAAIELVYISKEKSNFKKQNKVK